MRPLVLFSRLKTMRPAKMKSESYAALPRNGNDLRMFCFLFSATITGVCGLGEFPAEEAANNKTGPRLETRSPRWSRSCFAH